MSRDTKELLIAIFVGGVLAGLASLLFWLALFHSPSRDVGGLVIQKYPPNRLEVYSPPPSRDVGGSVIQKYPPNRLEVYSPLPPKDEVFHAWLGDEWTVGSAVDFAQYVGRLANKYSDNPYAPSPTELKLWTLEIVPYFEYEGVTSRTVLPQSVRFEAQTTAQRHNHVLGYIRCGPPSQRPLVLNARMANPVSTWYGRSEYLSTLTHELAHVQGICGDLSTRERTETETQIAAIEVMAAMINHGHAEMIPAFLYELEGMAWGTAAALMYQRDGSFDSYTRMRLEDLNSMEDASFLKSMRFWEGKDGRLSYIYRAYSKGPVDLLLEASQEGSVEVEIMDLPDDCGMYPDPCEENTKFVMDDFLYLMNHLEDIVEEVANEL